MEGSPGTMLAANAMRDWRGEDRWADAWRMSADEHWQRRYLDGFWSTPPYGKGIGASHEIGTARSSDGAKSGRGRYSLWMGDVGVALFAADCLDIRPQVPVVDTWD